MFKMSTLSVCVCAHLTNTVLITPQCYLVTKKCVFYMNNFTWVIHLYQQEILMIFPKRQFKYRSFFQLWNILFIYFCKRTCGNLSETHQKYDICFKLANQTSMVLLSYEIASFQKILNKSLFVFGPFCTSTPIETVSTFIDKNIFSITGFLLFTSSPY